MYIYSACIYMYVYIDTHIKDALYVYIYIILCISIIHISRYIPVSSEFLVLYPIALLPRSQLPVRGIPFQVKSQVAREKKTSCRPLPPPLFSVWPLGSEGRTWSGPEMKQNGLLWKWAGYLKLWSFC